MLQVLSEAEYQRTAKVATALLDEIGHPARTRDHDVGPVTQPGHLRILRDPAVDDRHAQPYGPGQRSQDRVHLAGELRPGRPPTWPPDGKRASMPASLSAATIGAGTPTVAKVIGGAGLVRWCLLRAVDRCSAGRAATTNLRTRMAAL